MLAWVGLVGLVAAVSGALALVGLPSPLLFGGLVAALIHSLVLPESVRMPRPAFIAGQAIIGALVGASVDWSVMAQIGDDWPVVIAVIVLTVAISVGAGQLLRLHRGVTPVTATFASVAGGASGMVAVAHDLGADDRVVAVIQYLRVLIILLAMPAVVTVVFAADETGSADMASADAANGVVFTTLVVIIGPTVGRWLRLPSPAVFGSLLVSLALHTTPAFSDATVPGWLQGIGFVLIGVQVGLGFTPRSVMAIGRMLPTAMLVIAIIIVGCAVLGIWLAATTDVDRLDAYLATTPGGLYAVLATSTATGGNVTFVSAVQLLRLLMVLALAPLAGLWLRRSRGSSPT